MIKILFKPYPDEILYSWIVRHHKISGNLKISDTKIDLFGDKNISQDIYFSTGLDCLSEKLPKHSFYSSDYLIDNNSLYPFYKPFMNNDKAMILKNDMKISNTIKFNSITYINSNYMPKTIKICPICASKDMKDYGEIYLHIVHQLQGITVCHIHECNLYQIPFCRDNFIDLDKIKIPLDSNINLINKNNLLIAKDAYKLGLGFLNGYDYSDIINKYKQKLKDDGYYNVNGGLYYKKLTNDFIKFYSKDYLNSLNSYIDIYKSKSWIRNLLNGGKNNMIHPIRHLLFINFIFGSLKEFHEYVANEQKPFGCSPWPCLNRFCFMYKKDVIRNCIIETCKDYKNKVAGIFKCPVCGFEYVRKGPDKTKKDRTRIGRIKTYGWLWDERFLNIASDNEISLNKFAKLMKTGKRTVKTQAMRLGINKNYSKNTYNHISNTKIINDDKVLDNLKDKLLKYINSKNNLCRHDIFKKFRSECNIIRKRDRNWYEKYMPPKLPKNQLMQKYVANYWIEKDEELSKKVLIEAKNILNTKLVIRITIHSLMLQIRYNGFYRNKDKLPKTEKILNKYCETFAQFNIRKNKSEVIIESNN